MMSGLPRILAFPMKKPVNREIVEAIGVICAV